MEDYKTEKVKKILNISVVLIVIVVVLLIAYFLTGNIMKNSYKTEDIFETEATTNAIEENIKNEEEIPGYSAEEIANMTEVEKTIALSKSIDISDLQEASVKKATMFLSCSESPWCKYMSTADYEVGKNDEGYVIDFTINGKKLKVLCSGYNASPFAFIQKDEFTEDEKVFLKQAGRAWEVRLDDGSYSIQLS